MKVSEIFKALEEGKTLQKIYHDDPESVKIMKREVFQRTCDCCFPKEGFQYNFYGWGSYGSRETHLMNVIEDPEGWEIVQE